MRLLYALLISALVFGQARHATDRLVADFLKDWQVPGLALGAIHNGKVIHQQGYGLRDIIFPIVS